MEVTDISRPRERDVDGNGFAMSLEADLRRRMSRVEYATEAAPVDLSQNPSADLASSGAPAVPGLGGPDAQDFLFGSNEKYSDPSFTFICRANARHQFTEIVCVNPQVVVAGSRVSVSQPSYYPGVSYYCHVYRDEGEGQDKWGAYIDDSPQGSRGMEVSRIDVRLADLPPTDEGTVRQHHVGAIVVDVGLNMRAGIDGSWFNEGLLGTARLDISQKILDRLHAKFYLKDYDEKTCSGTYRLEEEESSSSSSLWVIAEIKAHKVEGDVLKVRVSRKKIVARVVDEDSVSMSIASVKTRTVVEKGRYESSKFTNRMAKLTVLEASDSASDSVFTALAHSDY